MVGFDCHSVLCLVDRHLRSLGEKLGQHALMFRIEVLDEDKGHAGICREAPKELGECLQATGGGADADDRQWFGHWRSFLG